MPTFEFTNKKTGKKYRVTGPEGGTREEAFARLQTQLEPQQGPPGGAAPATYPGAADILAGQPEADFTDVTSKVSSTALPPADFSGVTSEVSSTARPPSILEDVHRTGQAGFGRLANVGKGFGDAYADLATGARQVANYLQGDKAELARLQAAEAEKRKTPVAPERELGRKLGVGSQFLIPGGAVAKGASAAPTIARMGVPAVARTMAAEGLVAGTMGGLQPTITGENNLKNAAVSGTLGTLFPLAAGTAKLAATIGSGGKAMLLRAAGHAAENMSKVRVKEKAREAIEDVVSKVNVEVPRQYRDQLRGLLTKYPEGISGDMRKRLVDVLRAGRTGKEVAGREMASLRSDLIKEADKVGGAAQNALYEAQRLVDDITDKSLAKIPDTIWQRIGMDLSPVRKLREARTAYRTGTSPMKPSATRIGSQALVSELRRTKQETKEK